MAQLPSKFWEHAEDDPGRAAAALRGQAAAGAAKKQKQLSGKLLKFDEQGKAMSSQDTLSAPDLERFAWQKFFAKANVVEVAQQERVRSLVAAVIGRMQWSFSAASAAVEVDILRGGDVEKKSRVRVVASQRIPAKTLRLVPLVKSVAALTFRADAVWQLPVRVCEGEEPPLCVYVHGSAVVPKPPPPAAATVERVPGAARSDHEWRATDFPWPFWLVQRSGLEAECNCVLEHCTTRHVSTYQVSAGVEPSDCVVDTVEVAVPVMTNTKEVLAGQELVVFWKPTEKARAPTKAKTWQDQAKCEYKKVLKGQA